MMFTGLSYGATDVMSTPSINMLPWLGISKPANILKRVVLPEPDAPSMEKSSPFLIAKSTLSTATTSPKCLLTPFISMKFCSSLVIFFLVF